MDLRVEGFTNRAGRTGKIVGRTPAKIRVIKPLRDGVIADFKVTEKMLTYFIQKAHQRRTLVHPRAIISVPSEITQVERRAVTDSAYRAFAGKPLHRMAKISGGVEASCVSQKGQNVVSRVNFLKRRSPGRTASVSATITHRPVKTSLRNWDIA